MRNVDPRLYFVPTIPHSNLTILTLKEAYIYPGLSEGEVGAGGWGCRGWSLGSLGSLSPCGGCTVVRGKSVGHGPSFKPLWSSRLSSKWDWRSLWNLHHRALTEDSSSFFFFNIEQEDLLCMLWIFLSYPRHSFWEWFPPASPLPDSTLLPIIFNLTVTLQYTLVGGAKN